MGNNELYKKDIFNAYNFLQINLFFELYLKVKGDKIIKNINEDKNLIFDINFDDGKKYILRNEYIINAIKPSLSKGLNFGLIGDCCVIYSFSFIISRFSELIKKDDNLNEHLQKFLLKDYNIFCSIITFFRDRAIHDGLGIGYELLDEKHTKNNYTGWKKNNKDKGNITFKKELVKGYEIDIDININEVKGGKKISDFISGYQQFVLIESIIQILYEYDKNIFTPYN